MRDSRTRQLQKGRVAPAPDSKNGKLGEGSSKRLAKLAKSIGNDAVRSRLHTGNSGRDAMLQQLVERLNVMRELQKREMSLMVKERAHFAWWREVADEQKTETTKPKPTRWRETAKLYEDAAYHLARGDLSRGREVMKRAMQEEERTREKLTSLVDTMDLEGSLAGDTAVLDEGAGQSTADAREIPDEVKKLVDEIEGVSAEFRDFPGRKRRRDPWWTLEEEEEEEEGGGDAGGG